ncbi:hypothetical protein AVEN_201115-1, partial [Araneus ventricosus]
PGCTVRQPLTGVSSSLIGGTVANITLNWSPGGTGQTGNQLRDGTFLAFEDGTLSCMDRRDFGTKARVVGIT